MLLTKTNDLKKKNSKNDKKHRTNENLLNINSIK